MPSSQDSEISRPAASAGSSSIAAAEGRTVRFRINPIGVLKAALTIVLTLAVLGAILPSPAHELWLGRESHMLGALGMRFHLNGEGNIPAFYSALQLLACALALALIARVSWQTKSRWRFHWALLSLGFLYLSFDEAAQLHEILSIIGRSHATGPTNHAIWVGPAMVAVVPIGLIFVPFVLALPLQTALLMVVSGMLFLGGAVGIELIQAEIDDVRGLAYHGHVVLEEALEMFGIALFLFTVLQVLATHVTTVTAELTR
jgi:hypothetical protein